MELFKIYETKKQEDEEFRLDKKLFQLKEDLKTDLDLDSKFVDQLKEIKLVVGKKET